MSPGRIALGKAAWEFSVFKWRWMTRAAKTGGGSCDEALSVGSPDTQSHELRGQLNIRANQIFICPFMPDFGLLKQLLAIAGSTIRCPNRFKALPGFQSGRKDPVCHHFFRRDAISSGAPSFGGGDLTLPLVYGSSGPFDGGKLNLQHSEFVLCQQGE